MANYELVNLLNVLFSARKPIWTEQTTGSTGSGNPDQTGAPSTLSKGCAVADGKGNGYSAMISFFEVKLREDVSHRTCRIHELNFVANEAWTVSIGGNAVVYGPIPGDTWEDVVDGLIVALPGVPAADALVTFTKVTTATSFCLLIEGKAEASYSLATSTTGLATMAAYADPESVDARIYAIPQQTAASSVTLAPEGWAFVVDAGTVSYRGLVDTLPTSAYTRCYLEYYNVTGVANDAAAGSNTIAYQDAPSTTTTRTGARAFWAPCQDEV